MQPNSATASRQPDLLPRSKCPTIPIAEDHRLVHVTDTLDWTEMEDLALPLTRKLAPDNLIRLHLRATQSPRT